MFGRTELFQSDPNWRDLIPFHEYFNGDDGSAVGASHQTGWTGLVAKLLQQSGERPPAKARPRAARNGVAVAASTRSRS